MSDSFSTFHSATRNSTLNSLGASKLTTLPSITQPYSICTHCNHLLTFNHHAVHVAEQETNNAGLQVQFQQSTRWSPTPIQLLVLEELYRQGTKTPSAEQIQQIASQLRRFGKIEGKNVFYWFQNHKARERQKRRRREMEETASSTEGLKETGCEVKETKKWASTSNSSGLAEEYTALDISEKACQFEERSIQVLRRNRPERQAKCRNMDMAYFPPISIAATTSVASQITQNIQLLSTPQNYNLPFLLNKENFNCHCEENADPRTLELFPLKKDEQDGISLSERKSNKFCANASMEEISCDQFFEFLPLRN